MNVGINLISLNNDKPTGAFRYIKLIIEGLYRYHLYNCHIYIYKQENIPESIVDIPSNIDFEIINVPRCGRGFKRIIFEQTVFYKFIKNCDVFYSYCTSLPLFLRARKVITIHDVYFLTDKERYPIIQRMYLKLMTKICIAVSDKILTVSEYSKTQICKYYNVPENKIAITYNFVTPKDINIRIPNNILDESGVSVDLRKPYYLYIGNIQPGKNIIGMVQGFEKYNTQNRFLLLIVGKKGFNGESILRQVRNCSNIYILGYQSRDTIEYLLSNAYATVLLSFCEGFGIPPIEGFRYNKPTLVSKITSLPEVAGSAGVLVDPYSIDNICDGFRKMEEEYEVLKINTSKQLLKFSSSVSIETFLDSLGVKFSKMIKECTRQIESQ